MSGNLRRFLLLLREMVNRREEMNFEQSPKLQFWVTSSSERGKCYSLHASTPLFRHSKNADRVAVQCGVNIKNNQ